MDDISEDDVDYSGRVNVSRPTLEQVKAVIAFMERHPDLAHRKLRVGVGQAKFKKLWVELSNIVNALDGAVKSTKGWIKFWSDKRRSLLIKQKQISEGKLQGKLTLLEQKILDLSDNKTLTTRKKKTLKQETCNYRNDEVIFSDLYTSSIDNNHIGSSNKTNSSETEEKQLNMLDKLVGVMDQQSVAMTQMAQASLSNAKALERLAEASHMQAVAVDRLAGTFETISASVHDVRNAILGIDYTMKRCYPTAQHRQNNIFS